MTDSVLSGITNPQSGDYFDKRTQQYLCIAIEKEGPKIIGSYSMSACQQTPEFKEFASRKIWAEYLGLKV